MFSLDLIIYQTLVLNYMIKTRNYIMYLVGIGQQINSRNVTKKTFSA